MQKASTKKKMFFTIQYYQLTFIFIHTLSFHLLIYWLGTFPECWFLLPLIVYVVIMFSLFVRYYFLKVFIYPVFFNLRLNQKWWIYSFTFAWPSFPALTKSWLNHRSGPSTVSYISWAHTNYVIWLLNSHWYSKTF